MKSAQSKSRKFCSLALLVAGGVITASALSGCGSLPSSNTPAAASTITATPTYVMGTPIDVKDGHGNTAKVTILSAKYTDVKPSKYDPAPQNGKYLVLEVQWEETSGKMMAGSSYINARDDDGNRPPHVLMVDNALPLGYVITGDKSKGIVAFDAKPGPVSIIISDMTLQGDYARVKLML